MNFQNQVNYPRVLFSNLGLCMTEWNKSSLIPTGPYNEQVMITWFFNGMES